MSGYDGYSMSNNARDAYAEDAVTLSGITAAWVKRHSIPCTASALKTLIAEGSVTTTEYHHTSKHYNATDFFRPESVKAQVESLGAERVAEVVADAKARKVKASVVKVYENCHVEWLEWGGTRKRPYPIERSSVNATVSVKGNTATITLASGHSFTKRLTTNGFSFNAPELERAS